jgi:hypothetical protein
MNTVTFILQLGKRTMTKKEYRQLLLDYFVERLDKLSAKELKTLAAKHT